MKAPYTLHGEHASFPKGTRVVTVVATVDQHGEKHRPGALCVVRDVAGDGARYVVETPGGAVLSVERSELRLERADMLAELGRRQWDERRLRDHVVYAAVVGSRAWGLDEEHSDEDVRGCFVLPFEEHTSIYQAPDEIHDDERQLACWEIEKLVRQALRADANTLETLWSPLVKIQTPIGKDLVDAREIFSSMRVVQSFGRYAQSQLDKLARAAARAKLTAFLLEEVADGRVVDDASAARALAGAEASAGDDVHALVRSLFDRGLLAGASVAALVDAVHTLGTARLAPAEVRPKNAYNLVRLLASCVHWLDHGAPLMAVDGALKVELMAIKRGEAPLDRTLARARELAAVVEDRAQTSTALPAEPDVDAADALVRKTRRAMARMSLAIPAGGIPGPTQAHGDDMFTRRFFPHALPPDVDTVSLRRFLEQKLDAVDGAGVLVALTGAHAYGFPSPDSDLDLKGIYSGPAARFLGMRSPPAPVETIEWFGEPEKRELDLSLHELGMAAALLLKGNGNMLERLLGPMTIVDTPASERLADIAVRTLSRRVVHHYRGFLHAMKRESDIEARPDGKHGGKRTAKRLLYAYRVACTGAHLLLEGTLVTDVRALAPRYGFGVHVEELVVRKRTAEYTTLDEGEAAPYLADHDKLEALLHDALTRSVLPIDPPDDAVAALDALLVEARLAIR